MSHEMQGCIALICSITELAKRGCAVLWALQTHDMHLVQHCGVHALTSSLQTFKDQAVRQQ